MNICYQHINKLLHYSTYTPNQINVLDIKIIYSIHTIISIIIIMLIKEKNIHY